MIDSTYLLPAFGVEIDFETAEGITRLLGELISKGSRIYISDLSPLECFLKAFALAEKERSAEGMSTARTGFLAVTRETSTFTTLPHRDEKILTEAFTIRSSHRDPFDCFIFATAKMLDAALVTEDDKAGRYVNPDNVLSWKKLRNLIVS